MLHPDLKKLRDELFNAANFGYGWGNLGNEDCRRLVAAIDWHDELFDIGVDALKRARESAKTPAPGYVGPYS